MADDTILISTEGRVATITINRPDKLNALNEPTRAAIVGALDRLADDPDIRVVILTGAGKAFIAGADIPEFEGRSPVAQYRVMNDPHTNAFEAADQFPKPIIAAINGFCLGGGCELAMACDIIIASENALFGQPEINIGNIPGAGGTQILPRLVGEKKAKELIFTGSFIPAQEALALGMINKVVPQEKLRETVMEMANAMLRHSPIILKLCKMAVNKSLDVPLTVGMDYERDLFAICFGTEDQKEGARAFLEKRKPVYKGK